MFKNLILLTAIAIQSTNALAADTPLKLVAECQHTAKGGGMIGTTTFGERTLAEGEAEILDNVMERDRGKFYSLILVHSANTCFDTDCEEYSGKVYSLLLSRNYSEDPWSRREEVVYKGPQTSELNISVRNDGAIFWTGLVDGEWKEGRGVPPSISLKSKVKFKGGPITRMKQELDMSCQLRLAE